MEFEVNPNGGLSNASFNLFLSSPALPHVHYTAGLKWPWGEQMYARLPPQPLLAPHPIRIAPLLVYNHKVDLNAPLGSFENPYSSSNAPPLPQLHPINRSFPNPVYIFESSESANPLESLELRPPTPPKRSHRHSSDDERNYYSSPVQQEYLPTTPPPMPFKQPRNTQPIPLTRNIPHRPPNLRLRPRPQLISTPHRPPPVHHYTRRVEFAPSHRPLSPTLPSPSPRSPHLLASGSSVHSYSRSPSPLPLRHHSPPYSRPLPYYSSRSPSPRFPKSSSSYSIRSCKWPLCMLCASKPATIEGKETRFCRACWEEAAEAEG